MPSPFDITTPSSNIVLKNRRGTATFTVAVALRRKMRASAKIIMVPDAPAPKWLTLVLPEGGSSPDDTFREFELNDTKQYQVNIAPPDNIGPTTYSFKLVVADEDKPEENFTESQPVTFMVPEPVKPPFPIWIIAAIVVVVLVVIAVIAGIVITGNQRNADATATATAVFATNQTATANAIIAATLSAVPTNTPTGTATYTPTSTRTPTLVPTDTPIPTDTLTPTPAPSTLGTQFQLIDNSVDYYLQLAEPGTIRVMASWVGFEVDLVISILDLGNKTVQSISTNVTGSTVEYTVSQSEWQANKVWRVNITNTTEFEATGTVDISYPSGAEGGQPFRDQFNLLPGSAVANTVVALSRPGTISAQVNWNGASNAIEARIRLPLQGDGYLASRRDPSGMTVTYDVPDLSVSHLWVISLIRQTSDANSGTLTVRYP